MVTEAYENPAGAKLRADLDEKRILREAQTIRLGMRAKDLRRQGLAWRAIYVRLGATDRKIRRAIRMADEAK